MFGFLKKKKLAKAPLVDAFISIITSLLTPQIGEQYQEPRELFGLLMTNKVALGYIFGMHDGLMQDRRMCSAEQQNNALSIIEDSYKGIFGGQAGFALFSTSISLQDDPDFLNGRMDGGEDVVDFTKHKKSPFCMTSILRRDSYRKNQDKDDIVGKFECEMESWPREQRRSALFLMASTFAQHNEEIEKHSKELSKEYLHVTSRVIEEILR
jgi:hypothetical protein